MEKNKTRRPNMNEYIHTHTHTKKKNMKRTSQKASTKMGGKKKQLDRNTGWKQIERKETET